MDWTAENFIATKKDLGFSFEYPEYYLEAVQWDLDDCFKHDGYGHQLSFLQPKECLRHMYFAKKSTWFKKLVPFARGYNGDHLFCFDASDSEKVFLIDLGHQPLNAVDYGTVGFIDFINEYRHSEDLPRWMP